MINVYVGNQSLLENECDGHSLSIHKFGSLLWFFDNFIQKFYFEWKNLDGN